MKSIKQVVIAICKNIINGPIWNIYGKTIKNPKLPSNIKSILFVCKGNICRSPFAEKLAALKENVSNKYILYSVGINVEDSESPPLDAINTAKLYGIDLKDHKSRKMNYTLMESYDMIIVMEVWQFRYLRKTFKEIREKIFLLPLFENSNSIYIENRALYNIKDPYGKDIFEYYNCFERIASCLSNLFYQINKNHEDKIQL